MSELDRIRQRYSERDASATLTGFWTLRNPVVLHLAQERERAIVALLAEQDLHLAGKRILDVGCGLGLEFANLLRWGAPVDGLVGIDLLLPRLQAAQTRSPALLVQASGDALPFPDECFDLVCQNVVFSSVIDSVMRHAIASEIGRVLKPDGHVLWYDIARTRARDPHLRAVPQSEVEGLFPGWHWSWRRLSCDLGLLRRVKPVAGEAGMQLLTALGIARTHLLGLGQRR